MLLQSNISADSIHQQLKQIVLDRLAIHKDSNCKIVTETFEEINSYCVFTAIVVNIYSLTTLYQINFNLSDNQCGELQTIYIPKVIIVTNGEEVIH